MDRFVNLVYALLVENKDADERATLDAELDAPTEFELAKAAKYLASDEVPVPPVVAPAWFGDEDDTNSAWAAAAGIRGSERG